MTPDSAYHARSAFTLSTVPGHIQHLHPFSITRKRLLLDMRAAAGAAPFGIVEALYGDALRWLWLCSQPGEVLEQLQAGAGLPGHHHTAVPMRLQLLCDRWCDSHPEINQRQADLVDAFLDAWQVSEGARTVSPEAGSESIDGSGDGLGE